MGQYRRGNLGQVGQSVHRVVSLVAIFSVLVPSQAMAIFDGIFKSGPKIDQIDQNIPTCIPTTYKDDPKGLASCNSCKTDIGDATQKLREQYQASAAKTSAADAGSSLNAAKAVAVVSGDVNQAATEGGAQDAASGGSAGLQTKSAAAAELAAAGKACVSKLSGNCKGLKGEDVAKAQKVFDTCEQVAKESAATAAEKAGSGLDMASLAQLAGAAMTAMAALKPQPKASGSDSSVTPSSNYNPYDQSKIDTATPAPSNPDDTKLADNKDNPTSVKIGDKTGNASGASIGNPNGSNPNGTSFAGNSPGYSSQSFEPELDKALGGNSSGNSSALDALHGGGAASLGSAGGASGGGSGGGSGDSSGASKMSAEDAAKAAAAAAAAAEGAYEIAGGAGGGRPAFLGLKSKLGEGELEGGQGIGADVLGGLGVDEEGSRDLASDDSQGEGISAEDGQTLFKAVHFKYAEIKKRGNI